MLSGMSLNRRLGWGAVVIVLTSLGLGADAPTKSIDAGGLTFDVPSSWKSSPPTSNMRRAARNRAGQG